MAMPGRAERRTGFADQTPTPAHIGPGTYNYEEKPHTKPSLAGFGNSARRHTEAEATVCTPGPGSYNLHQGNQSSNQCQGSTGFVSRAPRLAPAYTGSTSYSISSAVGGPGPGAYNIAMTAPQKTRTGMRRQRGSQHRLLTASSSRPINPPAIPCRHQTFGYNEDASGQLQPLPAPSKVRAGDRSDMVGPGDYNPDDRMMRAGAPAVNLANKGERKTVFQGEWVPEKGRPGPGDYSPIQADKLQRHLDSGCSAAFKSKVDRLKPVGPKSEGPGPGAYQHDHITGAMKLGLASTLQCFGSTSQRGEWMTGGDICRQDIPGPGAYSGPMTQSSFITKITKTLTDDVIGFGSTATRPCNKERPSNDGPGPGQYNSQERTLASEVKKTVKAGGKGAFGSTGDRWHYLRQRACTRPSDAAQLWEQENQAPRRRLVMHKRPPKSSFLADMHKGRRMSLVETVPPATQYIIKGDFDRAAELSEGRKAAPFLSNSKRFDGSGKKAQDKPGPGSYDVGVQKEKLYVPRSRVKALGLPKEARFKEASPETSLAGPGSYNLSRDMVTPSFNVTYLKKPGPKTRVFVTRPKA